MLHVSYSSVIRKKNVVTNFLSLSGEETVFVESSVEYSRKV